MKLRDDDFLGDIVKLQLNKCEQQIFLEVQLSINGACTWAVGESGK